MCRVARLQLGNVFIDDLLGDPILALSIHLAKRLAVAVSLDSAVGRFTAIQPYLSNLLICSVLGVLYESQNERSLHHY